MRLIAPVLSFFLFCVVSASAADFVDASTQIRFPDAIAVIANDAPPADCTPSSLALCRGPVRRYPDPRLGIGLSYSLGGNVVVASVFIYDHGESGFPDGADSKIVERQYEAMKTEIRSMEAVGNYRDVKLIAEDVGEALASIGPLKARAAHFSYERDGARYFSDAYLSALHGKLLKVRVTYRADLSAAKASSELFMAELGARVAEAMGSRSVKDHYQPSTTQWRRS